MLKLRPQGGAEVTNRSGNVAGIQVPKIRKRRGREYMENKMSSLITFLVLTRSKKDSTLGQKLERAGERSL